MVELFPPNHADRKTMIFVDGENFSIRYSEWLQSLGKTPSDKIRYEPNVYVWSKRFHHVAMKQSKLIRTYYYTSVQGDTDKIESVRTALRQLLVEEPSVFQKKKGQRSKQVDISLAVDMLIHASHRDYDTAVLVSGDEDFVPLVKAVKGEGRSVVLWFIDNGMSPRLKNEADYYFDLGHYLLVPKVYGIQNE